MDAPARYVEFAHKLGVWHEGAATPEQLREWIFGALSSKRLPRDAAALAVEFLCQELEEAARRHDPLRDAQAYEHLVMLGDRWNESRALASAETVARFGDLMIDRFDRAVTDSTRDLRRVWELRAAIRLLDHDALPLIHSLLLQHRFDAPSRGLEPFRLITSALDLSISRRMQLDPAVLARLARNARRNNAPSILLERVEFYRAVIDDPRELIERALSGAHQGLAQTSAWHSARQLVRDGFRPPELTPVNRPSRAYALVLAADRPVGWELPRALPTLTGKKTRALAGRLRLLHLLYHRRLLVTLLRRRPKRA